MSSVAQWQQFMLQYQHHQGRNLPQNPAQAVSITPACGMQLTLRQEAPQDYRQVEVLTRQAFWTDDRRERLCGLGADEHYLTHTLRSAPECIAPLDTVAVHDGQIIGHIIYAVSYVLTPQGQMHPTLIFGPLAVAPEYQRRGVGDALVRRTLKTAAALGYGAVLIYGHPTYYPRFGFKQAQEYGITTETGKNFSAFMALELHYGYLDGIKGSYHMPPLYDVDGEKACEFDRLYF